MTDYAIRQQQDERDAFEVLFCGIPAEERDCWYDIGLADAIGWRRRRFKAAIARLQARGVITLDLDGHGSAHARWIESAP
jgi:hypothetical protein